MVVIHVSSTSPRIEYVTRQVFTLFLRIPYRISLTPVTPAAGEFVIDYTENKKQGDLHIQPSGLLAETGVRNFQPEVSVRNGSVEIFPNATQHFGFDIFSAVFWMLTRYEEYLPFAHDQHQRFPASASLAYRHGFILQPVVDEWVEELRQLIHQKTKGAPVTAFEMINTIDVDNAYAYRGKGFVRQAGAFCKHIVKAQFGQLGQRIAVLRGKKKDPFDNYDYIRQTAERYGVKTIFFHLVGALSEYDRNISVKHPVYRNLMGQLKTWSVQGLHPSYLSNTGTALLQNEKKMLEEVLETGITHSRQHFLKLGFPGTYRNLLQAGIRYDFSMGFADHVGFRAGTGRAFYFFDLERNVAMDLVIQPLCIMEGTLRDYMQLSPAEAIEVIVKVRKRLEELGSTYVAVWHNETLGDYQAWKGWKPVYESQFGQ